ncbi:hypothetical protein, partial [Acinetobacter towneri]|uniref:hypothetical protein n=1 Tax=Acinetobacter towneri TaxID=202956 RepID=UPI0029360E69
VQKYDLESNSLALGLSVAQFVPSSPIISREVCSDVTTHFYYDACQRLNPLSAGKSVQTMKGE